MKSSLVAEFPESDWTFHKIPDDELPAAWFWEATREIFGAGQAYTLLPQDIRERTMLEAIQLESFQPALRIVKADLTSPDIKEWLSWEVACQKGTPLEFYLIEIDRSKGRSSIKKQFGKCVDSVLSEDFGKKWPEWGRGPGRKNDYKASFVDLAIYRAHSSGLTRGQAIEKLEPLRVWAGIARTDDNKFSSAHWCDAVKKTKARLTLVMVRCYREMLTADYTPHA